VARIVYRSRGGCRDICAVLRFRIGSVCVCVITPLKRTDPARRGAWKGTLPDRHGTFPIPPAISHLSKEPRSEVNVGKWYKQAQVHRLGNVPGRKRPCSRPVWLRVVARPPCRRRRFRNRCCYICPAVVSMDRLYVYEPWKSKPWTKRCLVTTTLEGADQEFRVCSNEQRARPIGVHSAGIARNPQAVRSSIRHPREAGTSLPRFVE